MKVFLSAVSGQFKACRDELASDLRKIRCEVRVQEDFQQGPRTLIERLEEYVAQCDRVIALIGDAYGFEASGDAVPPVDPPRSYTQWEYRFAVGDRLHGNKVSPKDLYVYVASDPYLQQHPVQQTAEHARRQAAFTAAIKASGKHRAPFDSLDQLCRLVLRDGWQMQERPRKPRNLPYASLGSLFKGRAVDLGRLHHLLQINDGRAVVIHGLGGTGKTRLAIEYALGSAAEYAALLSVTADSPEALQRNLAALTAEAILDLPEHEAKEEDVRVNAVKRWLAEHPGWLLILDNVDTPQAAEAVAGLLPRLAAGRVLVTSRLTDWSGSFQALELDMLGEQDAADFLLERTHGRRRAAAADEADALALAKELGGLALALEQAGAFIWQKRVSIADYLSRWREREKKVREWHDARLMNYPRSLAVTWDTSFEQLDAPARALLRMLCWLASEPVPRALLESETAQQQLRASVATIRDTGELANADPDKADMEDSLAALAGLSFIKWESGNDAFRIHRLVQEVARERLPADQREPWLRAALAVVDDYLPGDPPPNDVRSWSRWEPMRPHVAALVAAADAAGIYEPTSRLMNELGLLLATQCIWAEAESLYRRALAIDEQSYGPQHPEVATRLNNLAALLQATNRLAEAEPLMRRVLAIDEQSFGPEHPAVAIRLYNLAALLQDTNRLTEAEPLMCRVVDIFEKSLGTGHPKVATALNNLALLLQATNRLAEAEPLMRRVLAIDEQSFGPEHPNVATELNNLARLLQATHRLAEAEPLMRRAVEIFLDFTAQTDHEHPHLRAARRNYAALLKQMGDSPDEVSAKLNAVAARYGLQLGD